MSWDAHKRVADVLILVGDKKAWNKGYASEAWMGLIQYLKTQTKARKIIAGTMATNQGMLNLMVRSGMQVERICKAHLLWQGQAVDVVLAATFTSVAHMSLGGARTLRPDQREDLYNAYQAKVSAPLFTKE